MFKNIFAPINRFVLEEDGPTAVEYAVIVGLIIGVCLASITFLGNKTNASFGTSSTAIANAVN